MNAPFTPPHPDVGVGSLPNSDVRGVAAWMHATIARVCTWRFGGRL